MGQKGRNMERRVSIVFGLFLVLSLLGGFPALAQQNTIATSGAGQFVGKRATVCGIVATAVFAKRNMGQPTFLDLDRPHPHQIFTAVIWGSDRNKLRGAPETAYRGRWVCVTGLVEAYQGRPEIIVRNLAQIAVK